MQYYAINNLFYASFTNDWTKYLCCDEIRAKFCRLKLINTISTSTVGLGSKLGDFRPLLGTNIKNYKFPD